LKFRKKKQKSTPSLTAFRRKNALHGEHVCTPKLMPTDLPSQTRHLSPS